MDPQIVCAKHGGVATYRQLRAAGVSRRQIEASLAARSIVRSARGLYITGDATQVRVAEARFKLRRTCVTALKAWDLPATVRDHRMHLGAAHGRSFGGRPAPPRTKVLVHYLPADVATSGSALTALDTSYRCQCAVDQLASIDAALNRGLVTVEALEDLRVTSRRRSQWLRLHCDPGAQSPPETWTRVALRTAGLHVATQVQLAGVGRVDMVVDDTVVVEVDGQSYHMDEASFGRDRRRDRQTQLDGRSPLRFTRPEVEFQMPMVVDTVSRVVNLVRARGGRPPVRTRRFVTR